MAQLLRTLVVDDEERIRLILRKVLERSGHLVTTASSGEEALDLLHDERFDAILLDLMLGGPVDGQRVLELARWRWPTTVVIILTGHGSLDSAVEAIQEGVDGYLLKPVKPAELQRAVEAAISRRKRMAEAQEDQAEEQVLRQGPFEVDLRTHTVTYAEEPLDLSSRELALLAYLIRHTPEVVGSKELVSVVRGYTPEFEPEARDIIKWYIHRLRQKVEPDPSEPRHILNVRGIGYRFAG
jgi:DNA-binding response OmpR family regulator